MEYRSNLGNWIEMGRLMIPGSPFAKSREEDPKMETWRQVAIMRVAPEVRFFIGFISIFSPIPVMNSLICNGPLIGMRPGPENVTFVVQTQNTSEQLKLTLVEVVDIDDPQHASVPLY